LIGRTNRPRIVVVGDLITDVVAVLSRPIAAGSDTPAEIRLAGGGQGANTALWLAKQARPVTLVGCVGDDLAGRDRLAELAAAGVQGAVRRCPEAPTGAIVVLSQGEGRTMITQRGANLLLRPDDVDRALAAAPDAGHLHLSGYLLLDAGSRPAGLRALAAAAALGLTVSVDAASVQPLIELGVDRYLDWIRGADLLLANAEEAAALTGLDEAEQAGRALTAVAGNVVVKLGRLGAVWASADGSMASAPGRLVPVLDPTGAGDAFAAGLLAGLLTGAGPSEALRRATELGAEAVSIVGAQPAGS
jgi:sugar/nucleoside kinase (ribokinase family)